MKRSRARAENEPIAHRSIHPAAKYDQSTANSRGMRSTAVGASLDDIVHDAL